MKRNINRTANNRPRVARFAGGSIKYINTRTKQRKTTNHRRRKRKGQKGGFLGALAAGVLTPILGGLLSKVL